MKSEINSFDSPNDGTTQIQIENNADSRRKTLGLFSSVLLLCSLVIGTGIFISVDSVVQSVPSIFYSLLLWLFGGVVAIAASLCYTELALLLPYCGGEYSYFIKAFPEVFGFMFIFSNFLFIRPVSIAAVIIFTCEVIFESYFDVIPFWYSRMTCLMISCTLFFIHSISNKISIKINDVLAYFKFSALLIVIGIAAYKLFSGQVENLRDFGFDVKISPLVLGNGFYSVMWSYDGFNILVYMIEEMKDINDIKKAFVIGLVCVTIFYILINFSYFLIVGVEGMINFRGIVKSVAQPYLKKGAFVLMLMVSLSSFGSANSSAYSSSRIYVDAARRKHLPMILSAIHCKRYTPIPSLFIQMLFTNFFLLLPFQRAVQTLINYFSGAVWVFYFITFISVLFLRFKMKVKRQYKVPYLVIIPLLIIVPIFVLFGFLNNWLEALISVIVTVLSVPIYFLFIFRGGILNKIHLYESISKSFGKKVDKFYTFLLYKLNLEYSEKPLT